MGYIFFFDISSARRSREDYNKNEKNTGTIMLKTFFHFTVLYWSISCFIQGSLENFNNVKAKVMTNYLEF